MQQESDVSHSIIRMTHRQQYQWYIVCGVDTEYESPENIYARRAADTWKLKLRSSPQHACRRSLYEVACLTVGLRCATWQSLYDRHKFAMQQMLR